MNGTTETTAPATQATGKLTGNVHLACDVLQRVTDTLQKAKD